MAHAQQQLLDAVRSAVMVANTVAAGNVFVDRVDPLQPGELPAVLIGDDGETIETIFLDGSQRRQLTVLVQCIRGASNTAAADARELGLQVEKAINSNAALALLARFGVLITESRGETNGDGDQMLAERSQSWRLAYLVRQSAPDLIL